MDNHAQLIMENRNRVFRILYDTVIEVEGATDEGIHDILCRNLARICRADSATLAVYNPIDGRLEIKAIHQEGNAVHPGLTGLKGQSLDLSPEQLDIFKRESLVCCENSPDCLFQLFSGRVCPDDQTGRCYRLSSIREDELAAVCMIHLDDGQTLKLRDLVDTYMSMAAMILQRVAMTKRLIETNRILQQTQATMVQQEKLASIGQLAAGVAHEINNPLSFTASNFRSLKKYLAALNDYFQAVDERILRHPPLSADHLTREIEEINDLRLRKKLDFIMKDTRDLLDESEEGLERIMIIVQNLKSFSRVDASDSQENYDLNQAIEATLAVARNEIKYVAEIRLDLEDVSPVRCRGGEINQVLLNLVVNAAQAISAAHTPEDTPGTITIHSYEDGRWVCCDISDTGPGIPEDIMGRIFDPFFTTKEVGKGTGLGLNISYDIVVNKHKGELSVHSKSGRGSTFTIRLPHDPPPPPEAPSLDAKPLHGKGRQLPPKRA